MRAKFSVAVLLTASLLFSSIPVQTQDRTQSRDAGQLGAVDLKNHRMPPFLIWTTLGQRDIEEVLPRGATVKPEGRNSYLLTGVTDVLQFAIDIGLKAAERNVEPPGFSRQGAAAPVPLSARHRELISQLAQVIHDIIYAPADPRPKEPFPKGLIPDPALIQQLLGPGFDKGKKPPDGKGGKWEEYCEPTEPCVRPTDPLPEDVPDCSDQQKEVDYLLEKVQHWDAQVRIARENQAFLAGMKIGSNITDGVIVFITVCVVVAGGPAGALGGVAIGVMKRLLEFPTLDLAIALQEAQLADIMRIYLSYYRGLQDAYAELRKCREQAADAEARNSAAFQNFINVLLPEYYKCLEQRKCRRRWVPK